MDMGFGHRKVVVDVVSNYGSDFLGNNVGYVDDEAAYFDTENLACRLTLTLRNPLEESAN
jgi:hypothetical protein